MLEFNHRNTLFNSPFMISIIWSILFPVRNTFVSSVNNIGRPNNDVEILAILFSYKKYNNGPIIEPCSGADNMHFWGESCKL